MTVWKRLRFSHLGQLIFYDSPEWDSFWRTCIELDLPFYLHPGIATGEVFKQLYKDRMGLLGPTMSFAHDTSLHLCGMVGTMCSITVTLYTLSRLADEVTQITKGVFDRNPKLRVSARQQALPHTLIKIESGHCWSYGQLIIKMIGRE